MPFRVEAADRDRTHVEMTPGHTKNETMRAGRNGQVEDAEVWKYRMTGGGTRSAYLRAGSRLGGAGHWGGRGRETETTRRDWPLADQESESCWCARFARAMDGGVRRDGRNGGECKTRLTQRGVTRKKNVAELMHLEFG